MRIHVLTLFPEIFSGPLEASILGRAREEGLLDVRVHDIRDYTRDRHRTADDTPFGGGAGMVMKPEPVFAAVEAIRARGGGGDEMSRILLMTPQGRLFDQEQARSLSREEELLIICGRYEGVDERIRRELVTDEISIGDYVLTGGELPALVVIDAVTRLLPGAVGERESIENDSFYNYRLDYPHYTRPRSFRGLEVPEVLLSGHHERIRRWRKRQALLRTLKRRPDLLEKRGPDEEEREMLRGPDEEKGEEGGGS